MRGVRPRRPRGSAGVRRSRRPASEYEAPIPRPQRLAPPRRPWRSAPARAAPRRLATHPNARRAGRWRLPPRSSPKQWRGPSWRRDRLFGFAAGQRGHQLQRQRLRVLRFRQVEGEYLEARASLAAADAGTCDRCGRQAPAPSLSPPHAARNSWRAPETPISVGGVPAGIPPSGGGQEGKSCRWPRWLTEPLPRLAAAACRVRRDLGTGAHRCPGSACSGTGSPAGTVAWPVDGRWQGERISPAHGRRVLQVASRNASDKAAHAQAAHRGDQRDVDHVARAAAVRVAGEVLRRPARVDVAQAVLVGEGDGGLGGVQAQHFRRRDGGQLVQAGDAGQECRDEVVARDVGRRDARRAEVALEQLRIDGSWMRLAGTGALPELEQISRVSR